MKKGDVSKRFEPDGKTKATLKVAEDGSGSFEFSDLAGEDAKLSGSAEWTCSD